MHTASSLRHQEDTDQAGMVEMIEENSIQHCSNEVADVAHSEDARDLGCVVGVRTLLQI